MALTEQMILEKLHGIHAPGSPMSLVESGSVRQIEVEGTSVAVVLAVDAPQPTTAGEVKAAVEEALATMDEVETAAVTVHPLLTTVQPGPAAAPEPPPTWAERIGVSALGAFAAAAMLAMVLSTAGWIPPLESPSRSVTLAAVMPEARLLPTGVR